MILSIILLAAGALGLGYIMYNSKEVDEGNNTQELAQDWYVDEQQPNYPQDVNEAEINKLLNQLVDHLHAYEQYYEQKVWECHNCILLTEQCMALEAGSKERLALYEIMKRDVTEFNRYMSVMKPHSQHELEQAWAIALQLKDMELVNPEHIALLNKCWKEMVPYVISEKYTHVSLESNSAFREHVIQQLKSGTLQRKYEYADTHREMLLWTHKYEHAKAETLIANTQLIKARVNMEEADHVLAQLLAENVNAGEPILINAYAAAAEQALILKQAETHAHNVDVIRMELETFKIEQETANMEALAARFEQILEEHHEPGDELHPNLPQGTRVVPTNTNNPPPPPAGGGWWNNLLDWIWSWFG